MILFSRSYKYILPLRIKLIRTYCLIARPLKMGTTPMVGIYYLAAVLLRFHMNEFQLLKLTPSCIFYEWPKAVDLIWIAGRSSPTCEGTPTSPRLPKSSLSFKIILTLYKGPFNFLCIFTTPFYSINYFRRYYGFFFVIENAVILIPINGPFIKLKC